MELQLDIGSIIQAVIGIGIAVIGWFLKDKIKNIETGVNSANTKINELSTNFNTYREQALKDCSDKRQAIYNEVYKKDFVDTIKQDVDKLEGRVNNITNGVKKG